MPFEIDETHDPGLMSWVESANDPETDFPVQNLPFCVFQTAGDREWRAGTRIGDRILDLTAIESDLPTSARADEGERRSFESGAVGLFRQPRSVWTQVRRTLVKLLTDAGAAEQVGGSLLPCEDAVLLLPHPIGNYTDFYASVHHATNVGSMFRPDNPLLPNYKHVPIAYHGRASSIVVSGTEVRRPRGQLPPAEDGGQPIFGPSRLLDYELEVGVVIGRGNELGRPIPIDEAEGHVFGLCLVNDWSARDIQRWEYQPLGPFLSKSFATTISPYVVTMEALAPFRCPAMKRAQGDPTPLPYLYSERDQAQGGFDITLEVHLQSEEMRKRGMSPMCLSRGKFRDMYWTVAQMVAHHTSNGCNLQVGDLLASGTVSGPMRDSRGCLLELTWDGDPWANPPKIVPTTQRTPIRLPTGEERRFLADGDEVIIKGFCEREGFRRIGFGECRGRIVPALE